MIVLIWLTVTESRAQISRRGYPEHFFGGMIISGTVSFITFKKTDNKTKAWLFGFGAAIAAGLLKEDIDPSIGQTRNIADFGFTALGGAVGASIILPIRSKKKKEKIKY